MVQIVDEAGNTVNRYQYDEWGNILQQEEQIRNAFKYAGEMQDEETGLYYLRARYYDPAVGRFISKDSYEGSVSNPLSLNLYTYVENNSLIYVDPTGHAPAGMLVDQNQLKYLNNLVKTGNAGQQKWAQNQLNIGAYYKEKDSVPKVTNSKGTTTSNPTNTSKSSTTNNTNTTKQSATIAVTASRSAGATVSEAASSVITNIVRYSPIGLLVFIQGDTPQSGSQANKTTADDGTPVGNLKKLPKEKIKEMGGEDYTAPLKKQTGKSKSNLYWDPSTGRVYSVPNSGGQPQWVDNVDPDPGY